MAKHKRASDFFETAEGIAFTEKLKHMAQDPAFHTPATYSSNSDLHPDNTVSFVEKHSNYIQKHPKVDPQQYLSNLRVMTRVR